MTAAPPAWAEWAGSAHLSLGVEEELMLLRSADWSVEQ
jgi:hypothetical protein